MACNLRYATADTPKPTTDWVQSSEGQRISRIEQAMTQGEERFSQLLSITSVKDDGQVIVKLKEPLSPADRGTLLLDFEAYLKKTIDPGLTVWVEPLGDKNSLRNLRGIEVKA